MSSAVITPPPFLNPEKSKVCHSLPHRSICPSGVVIAPPGQTEASWAIPLVYPSINISAIVGGPSKKDLLELFSTINDLKSPNL